MLRAVNLPLSVVVVKVGSMQEENDSMTLFEKSSDAFDKAERKFIDILSYDDYKKKIATKQIFEYDLIKNIPKQVQKYFELINLKKKAEGLQSPIK